MCLLCCMFTVLHNALTLQRMLTVLHNALTLQRMFTVLQEALTLQRVFTVLHNALTLQRMFTVLQDALTLQRVCLEKKVELSDEFTNEVPDVRAVVQEMMTNLFIATYNSQDEEGRCFSDSFSELPERDPGTDPNIESVLTSRLFIKYNTCFFV